MRLGVHFYNTLLTLGAVGTAFIWGAVLAAKPKHRAGFLQKVTGTGPWRDPAARPPIWYHAVSVGEVMASLPLVRQILLDVPGRPLWISTVTATGQATARARVPQAAGHFYFPYDFPWIVDRVIQSLRPSLFITTETEIWPNCIWRLRRYGVPIVMVNGRISDGSFKRYRRSRFLFRDVLACFDLLCMQSEEAAKRIRAMGAPGERVKVTGNLKFDQDLPAAVDQSLWRARLGLRPQGPVWVAGSTHLGEEEIILRVFARLLSPQPALQLVLAPRAPERFDEVDELISRMGLSRTRRSRGNEGGTDPWPHVILLDTIGELSQVYGVASVGFVGGSLIQHGGHNPLEVSAHRRPVLFGPHMENFREIASLLLTEGGGMEVAHEDALEQALRTLLEGRGPCRDMGERAFQTLVAQRGAARRTLDAIRPLLRHCPWD